MTYRVYPEGYGALLLARSLGVPFIVGSRGTDLIRPGRNPFVRLAIRRTLREAAAVLAVSDDLASRACELGAPPDRVHAIHNGCDPSVFYFRPVAAARDRLRVSQRNHLILYVGRLDLRKGLRHLLSAMKELCRAHSGDWSLVLAGEGPARTQLESDLRKLGLQDNVRILRKQSPTEVATWMCAADVLCLPSESEGCPNVVVEALTCGCPVVATKVGAVPDLVSRNAGLVLPLNEVRKLAGFLREAVGKNWDRRGIALARSRTWENVGEETASVVYHALAEQDRSIQRRKGANAGSAVG